MLVQLLYISNHDGMIIPNIGDFINSMRERNAIVNLSSILLSTSNHYIHLIEGRRSPVNALYNKISKDSKHHDCTILRYVEIKNREFGHWYAEHVSMSAFDVDGMNLLSPHGMIDSETVTSAQALTMIRRIHAHLMVDAEKHR